MKNSFINACVLKKHKSSLEFKKKIPIPKILPGQVLVKIIYTSICGSQIMEINGKRGKDKHIPHGLGHEGLAEIVKTGSKVQKVKKGDKVILTWIKCKGHETKGIKIIEKNKKFINFGPITTFSNYSIISENRCIKKPKNLSDKLATFFGCSISTGFGVVFKTIGKKKTNIAIGIYGLGSVGFFSLIAARCLGFKKIFVIEKNKKRQKIAKKLGAIIVNLKNSRREILKKNNNQLLDYCYESAGYAKTIEKAFDLIHNNGTCFTTSHPSSKEKIKIEPHELIKGKKLIGSWGGFTKPEIDFVNYSKIISKNIKLIKYLKVRNYKLKNINKAISDFSKNIIMKPIIKC